MKTIRIILGIVRVVVCFALFNTVALIAIASFRDYGAIRGALWFFARIGIAFLIYTMTLNALALVIHMANPGKNWAITKAVSERIYHYAIFPLLVLTSNVWVINAWF